MDRKEGTEATPTPRESRLEPVENPLNESEKPSDEDQIPPTSSAYAEFHAKCSSGGGAVWW